MAASFSSSSFSVRDSQSARSCEKSISAVFQNFALPPAKSFIGRLPQLSPPASSDRECVRAIGFSSSNDVGACQLVRSTRTGQARPAAESLCQAAFDVSSLASVAGPRRSRSGHGGHGELLQASCLACVLRQAVSSNVAGGV